jgi:murein DD-endopeptidase MepM/ murein hydrolase activator NlpD
MQLPSRKRRTSTPLRRGTPPSPGGRPPGLGPILLALPLCALLLFSAVTGRIDLISAFSNDNIDRFLAQKAVVEATARAQEDAVSQAAPVASTALPADTPAIATLCEPSGDDRYCLYTVEPGDSLAVISARFGLDGGFIAGWELLFESNKPDLGALDELLQPGQVLRVPRAIGVLHVVLPGDSVTDLAAGYGVTTEDIVSANALADPDKVQIGDIVFIPEPTEIPVAELVQVEEESEPAGEGEQATESSEADAAADGNAGDGAPGESTPLGEQEGQGAGTSEDGSQEQQPDAGDGGEEAAAGEPTGQDGGAEGAEPQSEAVEGSAPEPVPAENSEPQADDPSQMSWPVAEVKITNYVSAAHPLGIDFGLATAPGSPITAAAGGTVLFAGGDACCSYGYYVIVEHSGGLKTLYAHLSRIDVSKGDTVARGQTLGLAGRTGYARGFHLHFEVFKDDSRVDPMLYLPQP